jgi:glycerol-3-phosphate acyltransferase PlsY
MKILLVVFSYLVGSIPFGYIIMRWKDKKDIRSVGSQSIGATNVLRLKGWKYALLVAVLDILKGILPVIAALSLFPDRFFALLCGFAAVFGHCFPIFIKFKGGKGVATSVGVFAVISLKSVFSILPLFVIIVALTRYVSLGSIISALVLPFFLFLLKEPNPLIFLSLGFSLLVIIKHEKNIHRLLKKKEKKLGEKVQ